MTLAGTDSARIQLASDQSLLVSFGNEINRATHERVVKLLHLLEAEPIAGVRNLHPAYCSILVKFDPLRYRHADLQETLASYVGRMEHMPLPEARLVEIPVCYGGELGPDLNEVAAMCNLSPGQVVELHTSPTYFAYFLGFVPGFAYLGELAQELVTPRLSTPRRKVPAGSVAIAGTQTGVYPVATPGGWRLLGRTPISIFRPDRKHLSLIAIGDHVKFRPISPEQFAAMEER